MNKIVMQQLEAQLSAERMMSRQYRAELTKLSDEISALLIDCADRPMRKWLRHRHERIMGILRGAWRGPEQIQEIIEQHTEQG